MDKEIELKANIELGVCPTHVKFMGGLLPDDAGHLPRDHNGELIVVAEMRRITELSRVAVGAVQISQFNGTATDDLAEMYAGLKDLGLNIHIILMVGGVDPMNPNDEDAVVAQLLEGVNTAKKFGIQQVGSTSLEAWLSGSERKNGSDFDAVVEQVAQVHQRVYEEADLANSSIRRWDFEFLRAIEFSTFTDLGRVWAVAKLANERIGRKFFKLLVDAAHCGDSGLSFEENAKCVRAIAANGDMGWFHASAMTTRGCFSTDGGWISALLAECAKTGELETVIVELFHHEDEALAGLRDAVAGHGVDTTNGRSYTELVVDGLEQTARRINNLVTRGTFVAK